MTIAKINPLRTVLGGDFLFFILKINSNHTEIKISNSEIIKRKFRYIPSNSQAFFRRKFNLGQFKYFINFLKYS